MSDRFIDLYVFNSQFRGAKNAIVPDLLAFRWTDADLSFYLRRDTVKKAVGEIPACKVMMET